MNSPVRMIMSCVYPDLFSVTDTLFGVDVTCAAVLQMHPLSFSPSRAKITYSPYDILFIAFISIILSSSLLSYPLESRASSDRITVSPAFEKLSGVLRSGGEYLPERPAQLLGFRS